MLNSKKIKMLLGIGAILVPNMLFGKTLATINTELVEIKTSPNAEGESVAQRSKGDQLEILDLVENEDTIWYQIVLEDEETAFVEQEKLTITSADATANMDFLNVRSYPDVNNSEVVGQLSAGMEVSILNKVGKYYKISMNGNNGFVYADYIDSKFGSLVEEVELEEVCDTVNDKTNSDSVQSDEKATEKVSAGEKAVAIAMKYLGNPYVYGGTSLTNGTDCSGFTQGVMKLMGVNIPRTSKAQSKFGTLVPRSQLQKGDLLFFGESVSSIFHVGLYIGDGKMIHASTPSTGIIISDAYRSGGAPLQVIRRVI